VSSDQYARSFSIEWNIFQRTQLDIEGRTESRDTFLQKTGATPESLTGKLVLDAGCGMGRFSEVASRKPTTTVVGFDLSRSVDAAYANISSRPNVHIVQGDIRKPPFVEGRFDFVYSIGVLHHMPDPKMAFKRLVPLLKKGGEMAIWVYAKRNWTLFSDVYRRITCRLSPSILLALSKVMIHIYSVYRRTPWLVVLVPISMHKDPEWRLLDTFDWYSPRYQHKYTPEQVLGWFKEMGFEDIRLLKVPVSVRGRMA
jgi:SAM-dependent methyltransferase